MMQMGSHPVALCYNARHDNTAQYSTIQYDEHVASTYENSYIECQDHQKPGGKKTEG